MFHSSHPAAILAISQPVKALHFMTLVDFAPMFFAATY
jgi:hypothetical protein